MSKLNRKTLTIAAVVLVVLALLVMATPLLRGASNSGRTGFNRQFSGQFVPGTRNGTTAPNGQNTFPSQGFTGPNGGTTGQGNSSTRPFGNRSRSLFGFAFLSGITGTIVYAIALLVSLAAAAGMILTKRWGQIMGIVMGVIYFLLALVSLLPIILLSFTRAPNGLSLGLSLVRMVLAVAVIVLALIPAKKVMTTVFPATTTTTPSVSG